MDTVDYLQKKSTGEASALEGVSGSIKPDYISLEEALREVRY